MNKSNVIDRQKNKVKEFEYYGKKNTTELVRVNINIPVNVVFRVKEYAESLGINVTSAYIVLLNQST